MNDEKKLLKVTIDGVELQVPEGTTLLDAAGRVGAVIPRYCYHPGLSAPAVCRMCLVEVEGAPKPLASCVQTVQDGMVVHTATAQARKARRAAVEFLLVNHPLDCPICDAAGQCELQDYAFETGQLKTRNVEPKLVMGRDNVTPEIVYFADRCILCTRCVRFMDEIAGDPVLMVINRGQRGYIDTMTGELFENAFSMNIVDVCPVGALVNEDYLFKARAWDLDQTASVCPGCTQGCNVSLGSKENRIVRAKPRFNPEVNSYWMCDHGRKTAVNWGSGARIEVPMVREADGLKPVDWSQALDALTEAVGEAPGAARAIVSPGSANESLFTLRALMEQLGFEGGVFRVPTGSEAVLPGFPKLKLRADRAANVKGAETLGFGRTDSIFESTREHGGALFVLDDDLEGAPEGFGGQARLFVYIGTRMSAAARSAHIVLPCTTFAEMAGSFTNYEGRVQRFEQALHPPGLARPWWLTGSAVLERLGAGPRFRTAGAAFGAMAAKVSEYNGLDYETLGLQGARAPGSGAAATAG